MKKIFIILIVVLSTQYSLNLYAECIKGNCVNGQGTLTSPDGFKYVGEWKYGKPHGQGTMTFPDGELYVGEFKDGKRDGEGKWEIKGCSYEGEWKLDSCHGKGKFINQGDVQEGWLFMGSFECHYGDELEPCNYIEIKK